MSHKKALQISILLLLFFFSVCRLTAQQRAHNKATFKGGAAIKLLAKGYEDSIVLRWAPSTPIAWDFLNNNGYNILRLDITDAVNPTQTVVTAQPLKPLSLDEMKRRLGSNNSMAAVAAQALYGTTFTPSGREGFAGAIADQGDLFRNRYAYALLAADYDAPTAQAIGLRLVDKNVKKGGIYIYKVISAVAPKDFTIDSATAMVENNFNPIAQPVGIVGLATDKQAELQWNRNDGEKFSGFYIERSTDGKIFQPVNKYPFYSSIPDSSLTDSVTAGFREVLENHHVFIDSLPQNYRTYYYRVKGINAFAEVSPYSETIMVAGRDLQPPVPPSMLPIEMLGGKRVKINWVKPAMESDMKGYFINKSKNVNGPFELVSQAIVSKSATSFIDTAAYKHGATFYVVVAVDTANNYATSLPVMAVMPDGTPPAHPVGLKGKIDRSGYVNLSWDANKEEDFKTYKVYVANDASHEFAQITIEDLADTAFVDSITLATLSKDIYYRLVAVDYNNNHSEFSPVLKLRKPDIVPPVAPVFKTLNVLEKSVDIEVIQSSSTDAVRYTIFKKQEADNWKPVATVKHDNTKTSFMFSDTSIKVGVRYYYSAEAVDEDSLHSEMSTAYPVKINTVPLQPAITNLKAAYDQKSQLVKLNWNYKESGDYFYILYRGTATGPMERYRSIDREKQEFLDGEFANATNSYRYAIKAVFKDGKPETRLSEPVLVAISK
jgi:fibronectin type 3 domain-containing protein